MSDERKLNILLLVSWFGAKDGSYTGGSFHYEQAKSLKQYCNCAIYYPYDRSLVERVSGEEERGILTYRSKYKLRNKFRNRLYMIMAMKRIVKEFSPDVIHGNVATEGGRFAVMLGKMFHIPVIITEHSAVEASGVSTFPHYYYAKRVYGKSRYNACVSDDLKNKLQIIFPQYEFHTVYNGIPEIKVNSGIGSFRKEDYVNIGMVAGFYSREIKGVQFVLPALKRMKEEGYRVCVHFMGGGEYLQEYIELAEEMGLNDSCVFYDRCNKDKLFVIESQMDFVISASLFESFGCAIAEGTMLGKPVVATKSGGVESIVNKENGILVEKGSEEEIYRGLVEMYNKYKQYDSEVIIKQAKDRFSVDSISRKYMEIYKNILKG